MEEGCKSLNCSKSNLGSLVIKSQDRYSRQTYGRVGVLEALGESTEYGLFVLLLNDVWSRCKYAEGSLSLSHLSRLTALEKSAQQLGPIFICISYQLNPRTSAYFPSSPSAAYCLAISATASPILFRAEASCSVTKASNILALMGFRAAGSRE